MNVFLQGQYIDYGKRRKKKLIDIGFLPVSIEYWNDFWTVELKDSGRYEVANPRQSTSIQMYLWITMWKRAEVPYFIYSVFTYATSKNHIPAEYEIHIFIVNLPFKMFYVYSEII